MTFVVVKTLLSFKSNVNLLEVNFKTKHSLVVNSIVPRRVARMSSCFGGNEALAAVLMKPVASSLSKLNSESKPNSIGVIPAYFLILTELSSMDRISGLFDRTLLLNSSKLKK